MAIRKNMATTTDAPRANASPTGATPVERMYFAWNDALARNDMQTLLSLYAKDARLESPLVLHLLKRESGMVAAMRSLSRCSTCWRNASHRSGNTTAPAI
jgi:hypothetical protein